MAGGYGIPLLLLALVVLAIASWRVVHPPLALALTLITGAGATGYLLFSVIPRLLEGTELPDVAAAPFEATARDARANDTIQLYRGAQLLGECALGGPVARPVRSAEPLRLERSAAGNGFQVWSGATLVGDLPESSLAAFEPPRTVPTRSIPRTASEFFLTGKVAIGGSVSLGRLAPPAGPVTIQFLRLNERGFAVVRVNAPELGPASPASLELNNKGVLTQSFERMDFDVAIREASFVSDPPWAAFAVVSHR